MQVDLSVGSVVAIPVSTSATYVAQVLRKKRGQILVAAFEATSGYDELDPPRLIALTFDSLVKTGEWTIVGWREPDPTIPIPVYKVPITSENAVYIQDLNGEIRREATADEERHLSNPVTYSAAAFQKAVNQVASGEPLDTRFTPMLPDWGYCEQTLLSTST